MDAPIGADTVLPEALARRRAAADMAEIAPSRPPPRGRRRWAATRRCGSPAGARVELGDGCYLGDGCRVEAVAGTLVIGPRALIGARAFVVSHAGVTSATA